MNKYNFTEDEINKILLASPMVLPENPSQYGMKGSNIKGFFYEFIRKLMNLLNEHFIIIERDKDLSMSVHNGNENSHGDIRQILENLKEKDIELGNQIESHYEEVNGAHGEIRNKIYQDILSHDINENAHPSLKSDLLNVRQIAENALNSSQGKTKVYPVKDVYEMINSLSDTLNVGDRFILSDKNVPDFTLFEKNSQSKDAVIFTKNDVLSNETEFLPGEIYLYDGYLLVASESGIDTSLLVKNSEFELLEVIVSQLDKEIDDHVTNIEKELNKKEDVYSVVTSSSETVTLQNHVEYNLGLRTKLNLVLPSEIDGNFECIVNFRTGSQEMEFNCDGVTMVQDDCYQGKLTPYKNRIYEINVKNVDGTLVGRVGSC